MPESGDQQIQQAQGKLAELLGKIVAYQHSLPDGRAVELDELRCEGVLDSADMEFMATHSVTYKPHRLSDYHAGDMFHMPTPDGGCVFIGPADPPLTKRRAPLQGFQAIVESILSLPRPRDELLLHIEFTEEDGMGVSPEMIAFMFRSMHWRERLPAIRAVAAEFGFRPWQDEVLQGSHGLTFAFSADPARTATATVALLGRGCGIADSAEITYSAGALDEG